MSQIRQFKTIRFWGVLILSVLLFYPLTATGASTDNMVLARVEVSGLLEDLALPVHAHLQGADGQDYALVLASIAQLKSSGTVYTILHQPDTTAAGKNYLIALERVPGARVLAAEQMDILHDDGRQIIVYASPAQAQVLVDLGFEIAWLSVQPLIMGEPFSLQWYQTTAYDPDVAEMIAMITENRVTEYCGNLSGENPVPIGGTDYEIYTRYTYNATWIERATQYVYEFMQAQGLAVAYHYWSGSRRNVVGEIIGTGKPQEIILVTAHLDCVPSAGRAPGADDNASGSVGVLLAAEIMQQYDFERTVRFVFFTGEEQGLLGSNVYASDIANAGDDVVAVINMDMIGWDDLGGPVLRLHTRIPSNSGYEADKAIADVFIDVVDTYGMDSKLDPVLDADGITASDHASFWNKGYAAILAIEDDVNDFNDYYHTANDKLDKLNIDYFTHFVKASLGTAAHLAQPVGGSLQAGFTFTADQLEVSFSDTSTCNGCTIDSWSWEFGDGVTSDAQNPVHTYAEAGTYTVKLTVTDTGGQSDSAEKSVTVDDGSVDYCEAGGNSQSYEWIKEVALGDFSNASAASSYSDFTDQIIEVTPDNTYALSLTPGYGSRTYPENWRLFVDLNSDGDFEDAGETLYEGEGSGTVDGQITIPADTPAGDTRLRVSMRYNTYAAACGSFTYGEVEDYTLRISGEQQAPTAAFSYQVDDLTVSFTDESSVSQGSIDSWQWDFGDSATSDEQDPVHTYAQAGTYTVTLTVAASNGQSDSESKSLNLSEVIEYCQAGGNNQNYEWIKTVAVGNFSNTSEASGYSDFTDQVIAVTTGSDTAVSLTPGFGSSSYTEYWRIWADLNRDGDFDDAGEQLFEGRGSDVVSGNITIPSATASGTARLRVSMRYAGYAAACGTFTYGEVEDYTLSIE